MSFLKIKQTKSNRSSELDGDFWSMKPTIVSKDNILVTSIFTYKTFYFLVKFLSFMRNISDWKVK
jgi:hypothetical protein